jgi:hypothetical protein
MTPPAPGKSATDQSVTGKSVTGKLHLLDLNEIKNRVGERWERTAVTAERFFEAAIRRHLGPGDSFIRQGELSYILLLRDLTPEEAKVKCCTICEGLGERLFGNEIGAAALRALLAPLPGAPTLTGEAAAQLDTFLEREGSEIIIGQDGVATMTAAPAPVDETPIFSVRCHHRPLWDTAVNVVINYLCQSAAPPDIPDGNPELMEPEGRQAAIDRCVLQECAVAMRGVHSRGFRLVSGVSVALDTISYSRLWRRYSRELQDIPPGISRDFIFFVTGIDSGVPNIRLAQELPKLSRCGRGVFCIVGERGYVGARFARTGTNAIGIELSAGHQESVSAARITELAIQAGGARLAAFVLGVNTTSLMLHALAQGIRYLEGPVIRPAVAEPRYAFAQTLDDIYAARKNNPHGRERRAVGRSEGASLGH